MKYLRRTHLASKTVTGRNSVYVDISGEVVVDSPYSLLLPRGDNEQQSPDDSTAPTYVNGMIRYNTESNQFEGYQAGAWRSFRFKEPGKMDVQILGTGDAVETTFALPYNPFVVTPQSGMLWDAGQIAKNLILVVENVFQIATVNYTVVQNPSTGPNAPYPTGVYVVFGSPVPLNKPIYLLTGFDQ
jgi:hypothetical protein